MTEHEYYEIIRFITQCFRDIADKDYINARFCYFSQLDNQCLWSSQQAIEKYIKSILLLNGVSTLKLNHDLNKSVEKLKTIKDINFNFVSDPNFNKYIKYLDTFGNNRYLEFTSHLKHDIILNLDSVVWQIRRYCQYIRKYTAGISKIAEFPLDAKSKKDIELDFSKYPNRFRINGGYIESLLNVRTNSLARKYLIYKNPYFGINRKHKLKYRFYSTTYSIYLHSRPRLYENLKHLVQFSSETRNYFRNKI
jgi:hypothetical protein